MESYEKEWLAGQPTLLAILHCVGLFDRPASGDCLMALRAEPAIVGPDRRARRPQRRPMAARRRAAARSAAAVAGRPVRSRSARRPSAGARMVRRTAATDERSGVESRAQPPLRPSARHDSTKAKRRRSPISRRSITPSPTAAAPGGSRRCWTRFIGTGFAAGWPDGHFEFYSQSTYWALRVAISRRSPGSSNGPYETPAAALTLADRAWVLGEASYRVARARTSPGGAAARCARGCAWMKRRRIGKMRQSRRQI